MNSKIGCDLIIAKRASMLAFLAVILLTGGAARALALTTNLVPVADSSLRNNSPDSIFGDVSPLMVGVSKDPFTVTNRGLIKFDFTGIPTNATMTKVTLVFTIFRSNTGPADYDLNRVLVDWSELEVTWNNRFASVPWLAGGGFNGVEYVSTASVTAQVDETIFSSAGMVSDVQLWLNNPGTNYGWMIIATGEKIATGKQLGSRESDQPPILTVEYEISPPAIPPTIFGTSLTEDGFHFSFNAESNRTYSVDFRDVLAADNWNLLTNIPAQPANGVINITNSISSMTRFFRVRTP